VLGHAREVTETEEKLRAMQHVVEHILPGRWEDARQPTEGEIKGTMILALSLEEASAKIRTGPPKDFEDDMGLPVWAGLIPLNLEPSDPIADEGVEATAPGYAADYVRRT
jgi:hypothetical protein